MTKEMESHLKQRIEDILSPLVGRANIHAQVTAQMDFSKVEQTSEEYKPNQTPDSAAIRSAKTAKVCKITMAEPVECQVRCQINPLVHQVHLLKPIKTIKMALKRRITVIVSRTRKAMKPQIRGRSQN